MKACIINHGREVIETATSLYDNGIESIIAINNRIRNYNGNPYGFASEASVRNQYLKSLNDGEWFLSIDSDEILLTEVDEDKLNGDTALVKMELANDDFVLIPRLIKYKKGMRYITHYLIGNGVGYYDLSFVSKSFNNSSCKLDYAAKMKHLREGHTEKEKTWKEYQRKKEKRVEKAIKAKGVVIHGY